MKFAIFALFAIFAFSSPVVAQDECSICQTLVGLIEGLVENNSTISEIQQYLDQVCNLFPGYQAVCDQFVEEGLTTIIQYIEQNETPLQICTQLQLCTSKKPVVQVAKPLDDCSYCEQLIETIENWVAENSTEYIIEKELDVVCTLIPQWSSVCEQVIAYGVPEVVQIVEETETPEAVCTQIGICSSKITQLNFKMQIKH